MKCFLKILPVLLVSLAPLSRADVQVPALTAVESPEAVDVRLEAAIDELATMVQLRGGSRFDFNRLRALLVERAEQESSGTPSFFPACKVRARFLAAADDLEARARRFQLHAEAVVDLQIEVIEARLDAAVGELMERAAARGATRAQFQDAKDLLVARARATAHEIDSETVRVRLTAAIEEIEEELARYAALERIHFQRYWASMIEHRLERANARLLKRVSFNTVSRGDYSRIEEYLRDLAEIAIDSPPPACP